MKRHLAFILPLLVTGCGRLGYESKYTANLTPITPAAVSMAYYETMDKSVVNAADVAKDYSRTCLKLGEAVAAPLAPVESVSSRTKMAISGSGKEFDIVDSVPPEQLLPLAQQRTEAVKAIAYAMSRTAELARVQVAAPAGFINPAIMQEPLECGFPQVLEALPSEPVNPPVDDFADVREAAKKNLP